MHTHTQAHLSTIKHHIPVVLAVWFLVETTHKESSRGSHLNSHSSWEKGREATVYEHLYEALLNMITLLVSLWHDLRKQHKLEQSSGSKVVTISLLFILENSLNKTKPLFKRATSPTLKSPWKTITTLGINRIHFAYLLVSLEAEQKALVEPTRNKDLTAGGDAIWLFKSRQNHPLPRRWSSEDWWCAESDLMQGRINGQSGLTSSSSLAIFFSEMLNVNRWWERNKSKC